MKLSVYTHFNAIVTSPMYSLPLLYPSSLPSLCPPIPRAASVESPFVITDQDSPETHESRVLKFCHHLMSLEMRKSVRAKESSNSYTHEEMLEARDAPALTCPMLMITNLQLERPHFEGAVDLVERSCHGEPAPPNPSKLPSIVVKIVKSPATIPTTFNLNQLFLGQGS